MRYCKFVHDFNCRCMRYHNQKTTGETLMSGEFYHHTNLINRIRPYGLHRVSYTILDLDLWFDSDMECGDRMCVRRKSLNKFNFKNNSK